MCVCVCVERKQVSESEHRKISEDDRWQEIKTFRFVSDSHSDGDAPADSL